MQWCICCVVPNNVVLNCVQIDGLMQKKRNSSALETDKIR